MASYSNNPFLMSVHSCKRDVIQHRKCDVANLLLKQPEKGRRGCDIFSMLYLRRCVCLEIHSSNV